MNPTGEKMECEKQPKVVKYGSNVCPICLQITGRGIKHGCGQAAIRLARLGRLPRARSAQRSGPAKQRKRNISMLVGQEADAAQEQIVSSALQDIRTRKGTSNFRMKLMNGGGASGIGQKLMLGDTKEEKQPLSIEVFTEIKKRLIKSKKKMEQFCKIMRKHKVVMTPRVRDKLMRQDHMLDKDYETIKIKTQKTVTEEVLIDPSEKRRGRKSAKMTKKISKQVEEEKDLAILKNPKEFLDNLAEERLFGREMLCTGSAWMGVTTVSR